MVVPLSGTTSVDNLTMKVFRTFRKTVKSDETLLVRRTKSVVLLNCNINQIRQAEIDHFD